MEKEKHLNKNKSFENKMILLLMIKKMGLPIPMSKIQAFVLSTKFMDYLTLSQYMSELTETNHLYITDEKCGNECTYWLGEDGEQAIEYFNGHIDAYAKMKIDEFVNENKPDLRERLSVYSSFKKVHGVDNYDVICGAKENNVSVFEVKINVSSKKSAQIICNRWKDMFGELYMDFIDRMIGDEISD